MKKLLIIVSCFALGAFLYAADLSSFFGSISKDPVQQGLFFNAGGNFITKADVLKLKSIIIKTEEDLAAIKSAITRAKNDGRLDGMLASLKDESSKNPDALSLKFSIAMAYNEKGLLKEELDALTGIESDLTKYPQLAFNVMTAYGRLTEKRQKNSLDALGITTIEQAKALKDKIWLFLDNEEEIRKWVELAISKEDWDFGEFLVNGALERKLLDPDWGGEKLAFILSKKTIVVKTAAEFLKAIASNASIMLEPGTYNLTGGNKYKNKEIVWPSADMPMGAATSPRLNKISNLRITGRTKGKVNIHIDASMGIVMDFFACRNIRLENLVFGHTPGTSSGGCGVGADVLVFSGGTDNVEMVGCDVFGCGAIGLVMDKVTNFRYNASIIRDCSIGFFSINNSSKIEFNDCDFRDVYNLEGWPMPIVEIVKSNDISFNNSTFRGSVSETFFTIDKASKAVKAVKCVFKGNKVTTFRQGAWETVDCQFDNPKQK